MIVGLAIAFAAAAALAIFVCHITHRHFTFGHVAAAFAVFHAFAVFAAILLAGAAVGLCRLVARFPDALRAFTAALSTARALAVFAAVGAVGAAARGILVVTFRCR